jgi:hypothetical protein
MTVDSAQASPSRLATRTILLAGLLAGTLDLTAACIVSTLRGGSPVGVFHAIASGLLGADAFKGGFATAALGIFLHFVIATTAAALFYAASRKWTFLTRHAVISGLAYGIPVYLFMNQVVLPLSRISFKVARAPANIAIGLLIIMFCIGLPIALVVRRSAR